MNKHYPQRPVWVLHEHLGNGVKNCLAICLTMERAQEIAKTLKTPYDIKVMDCTKSLFEDLQKKDQILKGLI